MENNVVVEKSFQFSIRMVNLYKYLTKQKKEFILSKQVLKSGTSIGANVSEAVRGQSKADFTAKMSIALKEASETDYWIRLLCATDYINAEQSESLLSDLAELLSLLTAICKTSSSVPN